MESTSFYGGDLVVLPLSKFIKPGKGDDVVVTIDHELQSRYGCLGIGNNRREFTAARKLAATLACAEPVMIAVEDPESGSPMVLTKEVIRGGKKHHLAVVFNAAFSHPEENRSGSFCLRMSERLDPKRVFSERIMYTPGEHIVWERDQLTRLD